MGFRMYYSNLNNITDSTANSNARGFDIENSDSNSIVNSTANSNSYYGFSIYFSESNSIVNSTAEENNEYDLYIDAAFETHCNNRIENLTGSNDRQIEYYNSTVNLADKELSELILCNASYSNIENVTINASKQGYTDVSFINSSVF